MRNLTSGALVALILCCTLLTGCTASQIDSDINLAVGLIDDGLQIAGALGVPLASPIGAIIAAGEQCIQTGVPLLEGGSGLGAALSACEAAVNPVIPNGTDASLAAKIEAVASILVTILGTFGVKLGGNPATAALARSRAAAQLAAWHPNWMQRMAMHGTISRLKAHRFAALR
jgi:predicted small secreted protein